MPKAKWNLNTIYISERLQESLRPISRCALTTVVAPMGYGKTTAVHWYLAERVKTEGARVIRISMYSDNLAIFWKSVQDAFVRGGFPFLAAYDCPCDAEDSALLTDDLCHTLSGDEICYIFIDDFHLLTDSRATAFLCTLTRRLPANVHLIVASRDRFLPAAEMVRLGGRVYRVGVEELRLNHTELAVYAHRCGTTLSDSQIDALLYASEGWFSAIYLHLRTLAEQGTLPDTASDIYGMFTSAMIDPLPVEKRVFLAVMGLTDAFTVEMARFVMEDDHAEALLYDLCAQNAFVKCLPDGMTYRFHHMMKECAGRTFAALPETMQSAYRSRLGLWYMRHGQYLHAMAEYRKCGDFDALLSAVEADAGILLSSLAPAIVLDALSDCPRETLISHPTAILVLMRSMFNWRQIPKILELKALLHAAIAENKSLTHEECGNLSGECDLIESFLCYNDIRAMSRLHRSASAQMTRPAISIQNRGGWTFGSPSVLWMFYRAPGEMDSEIVEMDECMPHYYKITCGHGQGAEKIMRAEALFQRGQLTDAHIALEGAYAQIADNGQVNMLLCCDFLAWRLSLAMDLTPHCTLSERYDALLSHHNAAWLQIWNAMSAYYYALRGETDKIPPVFAAHRLATVRILSPGKPMTEMIENAVYLAAEAYATVIGRSEGLLALCESMHYALVGLHIRIQTAAAYEMLGKRTEARAILEKAIEDASPDRLLMPFVENYRYLHALLGSFPKTELTAAILAQGDAYLARQKEERSVRPTVFADLTAREYEIVCLAAERLSNREIAEKLYLAEGSVKQYVTKIYAKLGLTGDSRAKRAALADLLFSKH